MYEIIEYLRRSIINSELVTTVRYGDLFEFDYKKNNLYPLSNLQVTSMEVDQDKASYTIELIFADRYFEQEGDNFVNGNLLDVKNAGSQLLQYLASALELRTEVEFSEFESEFFLDRTENKLCGITATIEITETNTTSSLC